MRRTLKLLASLPLRGKLWVVWALFRHPGVPLPAKLVLPGLVLYLAIPLDVVPDFIPVLGYLDDLVAIAFALWLFLRFCPAAVVEEVVAQWHARQGGTPP